MLSFALIHSPLVGPSTWEPVAEQVQLLGHRVIIPKLEDPKIPGLSFWDQQAISAARIIQANQDAGMDSHASILVGHSGAGPLLPAIGERLKPPPAGYIFVDAGLPANGASRLDLMRTEDKDWAEEFEEYLKGGGHFPEWSETDLKEVIPDDQLRHRVVEELQPRGLSFFTERFAFSEGWAAAPRGYIQFSPAYDAPARRAREAGWPFIHFDAGHFHMLVEPFAVAQALVQIAEQFTDNF